jgi:hypothetical protein
MYSKRVCAAFNGGPVTADTYLFFYPVLPDFHRSCPDWDRRSILCAGISRQLKSLVSTKM